MTPSTMPLPLLSRAGLHGNSPAIHSDNRTYTYHDLLRTSEAVARVLLGELPDLDEARVTYLVPPGFAYAAVQWGIWRAGGIAVPMAISHPPPELAYVLDDAEPSAVIVHPWLRDRVEQAASERRIPLLSTDDLVGTEGHSAEGSSDTLPAIEPERRALMLYTSGTTGRPKGVVTTHANIEAQVTALVEAWQWTKDDHIALVLPLHHVHGIINVLTCALWSGARCSILDRFDAEALWELFAEGDLTLFMAVPTIYARLLAAWDAAPEATQARWSEGCRSLRLMVSGSAALPVSMLERWRTVTGHTLLERYGMTEIGMALSNPLEGERQPGFVGRPLPGVEIRLTDEEGEDVPGGTPGEILVRGPAVFREYWRRPEETASAFREGWFATGDVAQLEGGSYRILGRKSVDIIKTGGYKVSALEVEEILRTHPLVADCAVVAVQDPEWGERVAVAIVAARAGESGEELGTVELRAWARERMAPYKAPSLCMTVADLPRNAMGKVTKPAVRELFEGGGGEPGTRSG